MKPCKNLVCRTEDFIFTWEIDLEKILVRRLSSTRVNYEEPSSAYNEVQLSLSFVPPFEIHDVMLNSLGTILVLAGTCGVVAASLPSDLESLMNTESSNKAAYCSSFIVDSAAYLNSSLSVLQVRWVEIDAETSLDDLTQNAHFLGVLYSDNSLVFYSMSKPSNQILSLKLSDSLADNFSDALGESLVSFDIYSNPADNTFNVYCLNRNGNVFYASGLDSRITPLQNVVLQGPLAILPEADDNYGDSFKRIEILNISPLPCVVLMSCSGLILHAILMPSTPSIGPHDITNGEYLQVLERVPFEYPRSVTETDQDVSEDSYISTFVQRVHDKSNNYIFWTKFGAFAVSPRCFDIVQSIISSKDSSESGPCQNSKISQLVMTLNEGLLGLVVFPELGRVVCTSGSLSTQALPLPNMMTPFQSTSFANLGFTPKVDSKAGASSSSEPFLPYIQKLLAQSDHPPRVLLGQQNKDRAETYGQLQSTLSQMRSKRLNVLSTVNEQCKKRALYISSQVANQLKEVAQLEQERAVVVDRARDLAEKYETLNSNQEVLQSLVENLSHLAHRNIGVKSEAENALRQNLDSLSLQLEKKRKLIYHLSEKSSRETRSEEDVISPQMTEFSPRSSNNLQYALVNKLATQEAALINDLITHINQLKFSM